MYLAIDIGGTKTLLALFSKHGRLLASQKFPTEKSSVADFSKDLDKNLQKILKKEPKISQKIQKTIVAFPGIFKNGVPKKAPNLPAWNAEELPACIKNLFKNNRLNCRFFFKNDADLGALAECKKRRKTGLYLTFSTGIGGGIIKNRQLAENSETFEPGHQKILYLGRYQEWEKVASAEAIHKHYHMIATDLRDKLPKNSPKRKEAFADVALRIALGLAPVIREQNPDYIVFSGPLGGMLPLYKKPLEKILKDVLGLPSLPKFNVAKRPNTAVIHGAYLYAKSK